MAAHSKGAVASSALVASVAVASGLAWAGWQQYMKHMPEWRKHMQLLQQYEQELLPPQSQMKQLENDILEQMHKGLATPDGGGLLMLPTYVTHLPDGHETGACFALDVGGTNFRCLYVKLSDKPGVVESTDMEQWAIPEDVYTGTRDMLFDFFAEKMVTFIKKHYTDLHSGQPPVTGFCWSFPVDQQALNSGKLVVWTKGFDVDHVVGEDVVALLSEALVRAGLPCNVAALVNDTIAAMAAARYAEPATDVGIILGTGTNAGMTLKVRDIPKWQPPGVSPDTLTAVNTEWGTYSNAELLPRCQEDKDMDDVDTAQRRYMLMEKMISGLYLGEVGRRILATFAQKGQLLGAEVPPLILQPWSFTTAMLSKIESDTSPFRSGVARVLHEEVGVPWHELTLVRRVVVQRVCRLVARRSARVFVAATLALLRQQKWLDQEHPKRVVLAVDGGVIMKYANWRRYRDEYLKEALGDRAHELFHLIKFRPTPDGSGFGAAVLAAAALQQQSSSATQ